MAGTQVKPIREIRFKSGLTVEIHQGDITLMHTDVIVNAANKFLKHGGGVAGAISRRGGPTIQRESNTWVIENGPIDSRHPAHTSGGEMPCTFVIHAVGPVWGEGNEERKLEEAVSSALTLADKLQATSISFPAISTGIFRFPVDMAANIFLREFDHYTAILSKKYLQRILLVLHDTSTLNIFVDIFDAHQWNIKS